jgi:hypothetical protein
MGRISVDLPDDLEKQLRFKTVERFGGKKGDLSRAVEAAVKLGSASENRSCRSSFMCPDRTAAIAQKGTAPIQK